MTSPAALAKPLLALPYSWREMSVLYTGTKCHRCEGTKRALTETTYCAPCAALPTCDECGEPSVDCNASTNCPGSEAFEGDEYCLGCEFGCGECSRPYRAPNYDRPYTP